MPPISASTSRTGSNGHAPAASSNGAADSAKPTDASTAASIFDPLDTFVRRHLGPSANDIQDMLGTLGFESLDAFSDAVVPASIRASKPLTIDTRRLKSFAQSVAEVPSERGESELLTQLRAVANQNVVARSMIGMGYSGTITPPVILRNILENPGWYTQYTPYQAEIAQGRLEALLNFQTVISDLTALPLAGASLLDEGTAAAEAMAMCHAIVPGRVAFLVADDCHAQTIEVVRTRAKSQGIDVKVIKATPDGLAPHRSSASGILLQYPTTDGIIADYRGLADAAHAAGMQVVAACDLLALTLITPPGEWGADIAVGSAQRFGVPMGFGGPHAAFIATRAEHARKMPGRIIGVSRDSAGNPALRMAIQTREQHIKREKATSNICTAQALLAIMASMYAVYHGPEGLKGIARRTRAAALTLRAALAAHGCKVHAGGEVFDTLRVTPKVGVRAALDACAKLTPPINLRDFGDGSVGIACDETTSAADVLDLLRALGVSIDTSQLDALASKSAGTSLNPAFARTTPFLTHPVFNLYHSEHEMLRYIFKLQGRDLSLAQSMIPLGSCTMKLNGTSEMIPVTWPEFGNLHPFAPASQWRGYAEVFQQLETWLAEITGFHAVSLQPNAGSQGEYAGLIVIRAYHDSRNEPHRDICLIPDSAHGTNPASAVIAGLKVVAVACDEQGNVDLADLEAKARAHAANLACLMVTYPSTHGVFEHGITDICAIVHRHGGQVYMDGANMNAQVGLTSPGLIGADVCHLNLHKTFCIPHGGGGPGMGPICVAKHLAPFLPGHPVAAPAGTGKEAVGPVSAAPYGSATILLISYIYIALMGADGLKKATQVAMLSANYMAKRLEAHFPILFRGDAGLCAHEFILDCRPLDRARQGGPGVTVEDVAKRLQDFSFHGPTMSWPVPGTLMIEPTESESKAELDRFCDAMIAIREEVAAIESGTMSKTDNPLKHAPHTVHAVSADEWTHPYSRAQAAFPLPWLRNHKFWPPVGRVDNPFGDRNLVCTCPPMSAYT
ncbi:aminomethyl-transferring glycine dehydrogenase [soil metagenome]